MTDIKANTEQALRLTESQKKQIKSLLLSKRVAIARKLADIDSSLSIIELQSRSKGIVDRDYTDIIRLLD